MLWPIFVASLVMWAFGVISSRMMDGRIHVLLAVAIGVIVLRIVHRYPDPRSEDGSGMPSAPGRHGEVRARAAARTPGRGA
jgi:hypothetical protein